jgi:hypothetical protein
MQPKRTVLESRAATMLYLASALIFFTLLAIAHELHYITSRLIEIGTIVEHFNRRNLRASGVKDIDGDDFAYESVIKAHRPWWQIAVGIVIGGIVVGVVFKLLDMFLGW